MQESECENTMIIYIPTKGVQVCSYHRAWFNIKWILHHKECRMQITKIWTIQKDAHEL